MYHIILNQQGNVVPTIVSGDPTNIGSNFEANPQYIAIGEKRHGEINTLDDTDTLAFVAGTNVSIAESGGSVTITSTAAGSGISGIIVQEEGSALANVGTTLNFVGSSVTATGTGATKTITISGGGAFGLASGTNRIETTLTIAGNPIYASTNPISIGCFNNIVFGISRFDSASIWCVYNLSFTLSIESDELITGTPILSKCRMTAFI